MLVTQMIPIKKNPCFDIIVTEYPSFHTFTPNADPQEHPRFDPDVLNRLRWCVMISHLLLSFPTEKAFGSREKKIFFAGGTSLDEETKASGRRKGVLWSGDHVFEGTAETLELLRSRGTSNLNNIYIYICVCVCVCVCMCVYITAVPKTLGDRIIYTI